MTAARIETVGEQDVAALLPLMRAYCDFYEVNPPDGDLLALAGALIADPEREGVQFIAYGEGGDAVGFATIFWSWSTARAARIGTMNDLFVAPPARGRRLGEALIDRCVDAVRDHGGAALEWQTALDNHAAQALYDRIGAARERWLDYSIEVDRTGA